MRARVVLLIPAVGGQATQRPAAPGSAFAKTNLHAWAFEEYDAVGRLPAERAQVLETVGLTKAGYVGRNVERMKEFDASVAACNARKIELVAVWTAVTTDAPLQEPQIQMFLEAVRTSSTAQARRSSEHIRGVTPSLLQIGEPASAVLFRVVEHADQRFSHGRGHVLAISAHEDVSALLNQGKNAAALLP